MTRPGITSRSFLFCNEEKRAGPFCSADTLFAFGKVLSDFRINKEVSSPGLGAAGLEPMRWNSVKKTCRWHVFRNSPDRACEGGVGVRAANTGTPLSAPTSPAVLTNGRFRFTLQSAWAGTKALDASLARQHRVSGYARSRAGPFCSADPFFAFDMRLNRYCGTVIRGSNR